MSERFSDFDVGRVLRGFVLAAVCLLLILPTVRVVGQQPTPTPTPTTNSTVVNDFNVLSQQYGFGNAILIFILVLMIVGVYIGARYYVLPMATSQTAKDQAIITMASQVSQAGAQTATTLGQSAQLHSESATLMKGMLTQMSELQTRTEAEKQQQAIKDNSNAARDAINEHTDATVKPLTEALTEMNLQLDSQIKTLTHVTERLNEMPTSVDVEEKLKPIKKDIANMTDDLRAIKERLLITVAPGVAPGVTYAPPAAEPSSDPSTPNHTGEDTK